MNNVGWQPPTFADLTEFSESVPQACRQDQPDVDETSEISIPNTRVECLSVVDSDSKPHAKGDFQGHPRWLCDEIRKLGQCVENLPRFILADMREILADFEMNLAQDKKVSNNAADRKVSKNTADRKVSKNTAVAGGNSPAPQLKKPAPFVQFSADPERGSVLGSSASMLLPFERRCLRTHTANSEILGNARDSIMDANAERGKKRLNSGKMVPPVAVQINVASPTHSYHSPSKFSVTSQRDKPLSPASPRIERVSVVDELEESSQPTPLPLRYTPMESSTCSTPTSTIPCDIPLLEHEPHFRSEQRTEAAEARLSTIVPVTAVISEPAHLLKSNRNSYISSSSVKLAGTDDSRWRIQAMVQSPMFDYVSASLVIVNAVTIGLQTDFMARNMTDKPSVTYRVVDIFFCFAFTIEIALRAVALGRRFFRPPDGRWNTFDFILVSLQLSDEILSNYTIWSDKTRINFSVLRIVRILRLIRIMRLMRILRLVGELRTIIASILGSLRPLFYTIFLLFMFIYVFAVYLTQLVLDFRVGLESDQVDATKDNELDYYYGTLARSIFSLYQAISGGLDWDALADPLMERISAFLGFVLAAYTAFCLLALMNVVTGVFVEAAMESAKKDRTAYILSHVKELFKKADPENTGTLNWDRFQGSLNEDFMQEIFKTIDVCLSEARSVFSLLDSDDSGEIELDEFLNGCLGLHGPAKAVHLATLMYETRIATRFHAQHVGHIEQLIIRILDAMDVDHGAKPAIPGELAHRKTFVLENGTQFPVEELEGVGQPPPPPPRRFSFDLDPQVLSLKAQLPGVVTSDSTACTDFDR